VKQLECDICVIGAGSGGLSVAAAASQFGENVVLIERGEMGGDCLNYGCVPSKALLAAGKHAHAFTSGEAFGIAAQKPKVDFGKVHDHVHSVIGAIAPHDSQERFEGLGVTVIRETGRFVDGETVEAGETRIKARRFVIATGSSPAAPPIPGLDARWTISPTRPCSTTRPCLTHLLVIGGGPIGMEMAQAHRRLGAKVTVLEAFQPLGKDDPELTSIVLDHLRGEGIDIRAGVKITDISQSAKGITIALDEDGKADSADRLASAGGGGPQAQCQTSLNLDAAGIGHDKRGIKVDDSLRTSNRKVYAIGDVAGGLQFTHVAGYQAGLVVRAILFRLPVKNDTRCIPLGDLHRSRTGPHRPDRGAGTRNRASDHKVLRWHVQGQ
jgi:pyruvate/2-oxoglutarate dehydrogenase complex dihydrolipoamide dehydrogenase (E3) component